MELTLNTTEANPIVVFRPDEWRGALQNQTPLDRVVEYFGERKQHFSRSIEDLTSRINEWERNPYKAGLKTALIGVAELVGGVALLILVALYLSLFSWNLVDDAILMGMFGITLAVGPAFAVGDACKRIFYDPFFALRGYRAEKAADETNQAVVVGKCHDLVGLIHIQRAAWEQDRAVRYPAMVQQGGVPADAVRFAQNQIGQLDAVIPLLDREAARLQAQLAAN